MIYGIKNEFFLRHTGRNPEHGRYRHHILPSRVANHSAGFRLSCPLRKLVMIIVAIACFKYSDAVL